MKNNKLLMIGLVGLTFGVVSLVEAMEKKMIPFRLNNWEKFPIEIKFQKNSTPIIIEAKKAYEDFCSLEEKPKDLFIRERSGEPVPAKKVFGIKVSSEKLQGTWGPWKEYRINLFPQTSRFKDVGRDAIFLKYGNSSLYPDIEHEKDLYPNRVQQGHIYRP